MKYIFIFLIFCIFLSGCQQETLAEKIDTSKVTKASEELIEQATQSAIYKETEKEFVNSVKENLKKRIEEF